MSSGSYKTRADNRRSLIQSGALSDDGLPLNGIDYVEVHGDPMDGAFPGVELGEAVLRVRFLRPERLGALRLEHILIDGGQRIPSVRPVGLRVGALPAGVADDITDADSRDLWVLVPSHGDWSTYTLRLLEEDGREPPPGFDHVLSAVAFSFKLDCSSELDCGPTPPPDPGEAQGPQIDYLGRDYQSFRTLMLDRMATVAPEWVERNPADLGVALVEAIAHVADGLSYYQDAVATEGYLATARRRASVRRHARLLDYQMHEGCSARALVTVQLWEGSAAEGEVLPRGIPFLTRLDGADVGIVSGSDKEQEALGRAPVVFESLHPVTLYYAHNVLQIHSWGEDDAVLEEGATSAVLLDPRLDPSAAPLNLRRGDVIVFVEQYRVGERGRVGAAFADRSRRHAVRLSADPEPLKTRDVLVPDPRDSSVGSPLIRVRWHPLDALPFDLCLRIHERPTGDAKPLGGHHDDKVIASVAMANVVLVDHGRSVPPEALPLPRAGEPYRPVLQAAGVAHTAPYAAAAAAARPVAAALSVEPAAAVSAVSIDAPGRTWSARRDLLGSGRYSEDFVVEMRADRRATLRFGDGVHGRAPDGGGGMVARYRVGGGVRGNLAADALSHVILDSADLAAAIAAVSNPLAASGGAEPESIDRVKLHAPHHFKRQERAVRPEDYQEVTERHLEVSRAVASFRWTGSWRTVTVTVDRAGGQPVDEAFQRELVAFLEPFRMAGHDLQVRPPDFISLELSLVIHVEEDRLASEVEAAVREVLSAGVRSGNTPGFFHPDRLSFGQSIYLSQIIAEVMGVTGVRRVDTYDEPRVRFRRLGDPLSSGLVEGRLRFGPLEIPRLDADPNAPENGRLEIFMEGGL